MPKKTTKKAKPQDATLRKESIASLTGQLERLTDLVTELEWRIDNLEYDQRERSEGQ